MSFPSAHTVEKTLMIVPAVEAEANRRPFGDSTSVLIGDWWQQIEPRDWKLDASNRRAVPGCTVLVESATIGSVSDAVAMSKHEGLISSCCSSCMPEMLYSLTEELSTTSNLLRFILKPTMLPSILGMGKEQIVVFFFVFSTVNLVEWSVSFSVLGPPTTSKDVENNSSATFLVDLVECSGRE